MNRMKTTIRKWWFWLLLTPLLPAAAYFIFILGRPLPFLVKSSLYEGVTYYRQVRYMPHPMIAHVLVIDTRNAGGIHFLVTPPNDTGTVVARTTSQFLDEFDLQIAINGDGFTPWWSRSPLDYYPHIGDPVTPNGFAASYGRIYADGRQDAKPEPTLYINRRGGLEFNHAPGRIFQAISGDRMLIKSGEIVAGLNDQILHPRTALGLNQNGRWLIILVVDGRQPLYSEGATYQELAEILLDFGAFNAMALDGGGSSTMVIEGPDGRPQVLNSPIDNYIPGRERPVANHLGIYLDQ